MDVWGITVAALRRWYIFLAILGLAGFGAHMVGKSVHPEYEASASALLTPPPTAAPVANPFGNVDGANQAIAIILNGPGAEAAVAQQGLTPSFTVTSQARSSIFNVAVRGVNPDKAVATTEAVLDIASRELIDRQTAGGVPEANQISMQVLSAPAITNVVTDGALRVQAVILVLGAAIALTVAVLFDEIMQWFRRRRRGKKAEPVVVPPGQPDPQINGRSSSHREVPQLGSGETGAPARPTRRLRPRGQAAVPGGSDSINDAALVGTVSVGSSPGSYRR